MAIDLKHNGNIEVTNGVITIDGSPVGGGLEGTQYIYVQAQGTDTENATELQDAYNTAKTKVKIVQILSENLIDTVFFGDEQTINNGSNFWYPIQSMFDEPLSLGVQNVVVVSDEFTGTIEIDVTYTDEYRLEFNYSGTQLTNVTSFKNFITGIQRTTVIVGAGYYNFSSDFIMDEEYVDLVSLDGNRSVVFNGTGTISITANDVFVKGIDVGTKNFTIGDNLNLLKVENCQGGDFSFGGDATFGSNPLIVNGTFTNCVGGNDSFGRSGTASGTFTNCQGGGSSFGRDDTASGTFTNCIGGFASFANNGTASGTFTNCVGGSSSFGRSGTASGTFTNCVGGFRSFGGFGTLNGKLYYCRLTSNTFETVSSGGITRLCIDGSNNENNQG